MKSVSLSGFIWEAKINGLLVTSAAANFPPGAPPRWWWRATGVCSSSCTDQASACYLLGLEGRIADGWKKQEGPSLSSRDSSKYIDKIIRGQEILVLGGGASHSCGGTVTGAGLGGGPGKVAFGPGLRVWRGSPQAGRSLFL